MEHHVVPFKHVYDNLIALFTSLIKHDPHFNEFVQMLDSRMKELNANGVGLIKKSADPVTKKDGKQLWKSEVISLYTSVGLQNGAFLYSCKLFGLTEHDEHRNLTAEHFTVTTDDEIHTEVLTFRETTSKANQGGINDRKGRAQSYTPVCRPSQ